MKQAVVFPRTRDLKTDTKNILKFRLTKHLTNRFLYTIFSFVKGIKPDDQMETSVGTRGSDSLLHSLSSGLWAPNTSLECPISFSPFLPFGTLGNTAGDGGVFFFTNRYAKSRLIHVKS